VLEEKRFRRLGDVKDRTVDVRLIAATHRELRSAVEERRFRQDLYYRISTLEIHVPALRDRREDIPILGGSILDRLARDLGQKRVSIGPDAERILTRYDWPGNIRELRNVLERALLRSHGDILDASAIVMPSESPAAATSGSMSATIVRAGTLEDVEKDYIEQVLREESGSIDRVAIRLGISRSAVYYKARKHSIAISKVRG
jgi:transcriptional regulator with PAS, ATPase and Fis domain